LFCVTYYKIDFISGQSPIRGVGKERFDQEERMLELDPDEQLDLEADLMMYSELTKPDGSEFQQLKPDSENLR